MGKTENNEHVDADILESKADILRMRDIIPGGGPARKSQQETKSQISSQETISEADTSKTPTENQSQEKAKIPSFDLAEDIMAEHRKFTSIRRKAPDKKAETQTQELEVEQFGYTIRQSTLGLSKEEPIIAEIVARDIERLRQGSRAGVF